MNFHQLDMYALNPVFSLHFYITLHSCNGGGKAGNQLLLGKVNLYAALITVRP